MAKKKRDGVKRGKVVYCQIHGADSPAYGSDNNLRCLRCAREAKKVRREVEQKRHAGQDDGEGF